ncbi:MAG: hypothetical protein C0501_11175 [Isosphaera sp.]|nr:hypothetical protein [Isosphaera sp.]
MISVVCPNPSCRRPLRVDDRSAGQAVECVYCQCRFEVDLLPDETTSGAAAVGGTLSSPGPGRHPTTVDWPVGQYLDEAVPRRPGDPPPLPPRADAAGSGLRVGPLLVSIVSVAVIAGSLAGIISLLRPAPEGPGPAPAGAAERWAAVAVESSGVRLVIVDVSRTADGREVAGLTVDTKKNRDWGGFAPPKGAGPKVPPEPLAELERILAKYAEEVKARNVPPARFLVASNGKVLRPFAGADQAEAEQALRAAVRKGTGQDLDVVNPQDEIAHAARGAIAHKHRTVSALFDIGRGATGHGYFDTTTSFRGAELKDGLTACEKEIAAHAAKEKVPFPAAADACRRALAERVGAAATSTPALRNSSRYYLFGGSAWALAVVTHPEAFVPDPDARAAEVRIAPGDVDRYLALVRSAGSFAEVKKDALDRRPPGTPPDHLDAELSAVGRQFNVQQLVAGGTLLKALSDECQLAGPDKVVNFYINSLHAWPVGYILTRGGFEK